MIHLMKNIRNNWVAEPMGDLNLTNEDRRLAARWAISAHLHKLENRSVEENSGEHGLCKL